MNASNLLKTQIQETSEFCPDHNIKKVSMGGRVVCPDCAREFMQKVQSDHQKQVNKMVRDNHFAGARLPLRHADSGFNNYHVKNEGQRKAKHQCVKFVKDFSSNIKRNLIMVGRTGTGKTHLACAVARNILATGKFARYITSEDMANQIANAWKVPDDNEVSAIFRFTDVDLLILDEYGLNDRYENRLQLVHKVLYSRYDELKPTMVISNMTAEELKIDLGDRLWSRFQHEGLEIAECNWHDQRVGGVV